jgi:hypothetical protein
VERLRAESPERPKADSAEPRKAESLELQAPVKVESQAPQWRARAAVQARAAVRAPSPRSLERVAWWVPPAARRRLGSAAYPGLAARY